MATYSGRLMGRKGDVICFFKGKENIILQHIKNSCLFVCLFTHPQTERRRQARTRGRKSRCVVSKHMLDCHAYLSACRQLAAFSAVSFSGSATSATLVKTQQRRTEQRLECSARTEPQSSTTVHYTTLHQIESSSCIQIYSTNIKMCRSIQI
jgi:hypothetical protein